MRSSRWYPTMRRKRFIGFANATIAIPNTDSDDIGVHQPPELRFTFSEVAVQLRIFERRRGLGREQF